MTTLGDVIHEARLTKGLTLREVAAELSISAMYLSEIETGKKIPLDSDVLPLIARFFALDEKNLLALAIEEKMASKKIQAERRFELSAARRQASETEVAQKVRSAINEPKEEP